MIMMRGKKKTAARGASRKAVKPSREPVSLQGLVSKCLPVLMPMFMAVVIAGSGFAIYQGVNWLQAQPVERVVITGELQHVDKHVLTNNVKPWLRDGFIAADLAAIREQLEQTPWVFNVQVERQWPGTLLVHVTEQKPIARWGKRGLLNHLGQVYVPEKMPEMLTMQNQLPQLIGPAATEGTLIHQFSAMAKVLHQHDLLLTNLQLNNSGAWQAVLVQRVATPKTESEVAESGQQADIKPAEVTMLLGRGAVMEKVNRFTKVYQQQLQTEFARVERIDLRYSNGLAVAWREDVESQTVEINNSNTKA